MEKEEGRRAGFWFLAKQKWKRVKREQVHLVAKLQKACFSKEERKKIFYFYFSTAVWFQQVFALVLLLLFFAKHSLPCLLFGFISPTQRQKKPNTWGWAGPVFTFVVRWFFFFLWTFGDLVKKNIFFFLWKEISLNYHNDQDTWKRPLTLSSSSLNHNSIVFLERKRECPTLSSVRFC